MAHAYIGGPLSLLKTGDIVEIDVNKRSINMLVDDETLQKRKSNLVQKFDFLETDFGNSAKEPDIF